MATFGFTQLPNCEQVKHQNLYFTETTASLPLSGIE